VANTLDRFEEVAGDYDGFTEAIPKYSEMMDVMMEVLLERFANSSPETVVELGIGTGTFASELVEIVRPNRFVGVDAVGSMLERSREQFEDRSDVTDILLQQSRFETWEPEGSLDCVYSSLSIHHMADLEKKALYSRIHDALKPGGLFLLCDLVKVTGSRKKLYRSIYRQRLKSMGFDKSTIRERWEQHENHDRPAGLRPTLRWFREIGFSTVECVWKDLNRAIILTFK
jgi:tRNA (cmo5U34)-methyltransferase